MNAELRELSTELARGYREIVKHAGTSKQAYEVAAVIERHADVLFLAYPEEFNFPAFYLMCGLDEEGNVRDV